MIIPISSRSQVSDIQRDFNLLFPFLKIEFFKRTHGYKEASPKRAKLPHYLYVGDLAGHLPDHIQVTESMTVQELEQLFEDQLGLHSQVFRKSGSLWLETTITDSWTLKQQNDHGMEISLLPASPLGGARNKDPDSDGE